MRFKTKYFDKRTTKILIRIAIEKPRVAPESGTLRALGAPPLTRSLTHCPTTSPETSSYYKWSSDSLRNCQNVDVVHYCNNNNNIATSLPPPRCTADSDSFDHVTKDPFDHVTKDPFGHDLGHHKPSMTSRIRGLSTQPLSLLTWLLASSPSLVLLKRPVFFPYPTTSIGSEREQP